MLTMVRVGRSRTDVSCTEQELLEARAEFQERAYIRLPGFVEPGLLRDLLALLDRASFYTRDHAGIGTEECATPGAVTAALELVMNDPELRRFIGQLTGCGPLGCFEGRVYRLHPTHGHYDSWHSDVGENRQLALSINLSREPFDGGALQIRAADALHVLATVENRVPGDAVLFRVHPSMRHRVGAVTGLRARTAWAGWFRTVPDFAELLADRLKHQSV